MNQTQLKYSQDFEREVVKVKGIDYVFPREARHEEIRKSCLRDGKASIINTKTQVKGVFLNTELLSLDFLERFNFVSFHQAYRQTFNLPLNRPVNIENREVKSCNQSFGFKYEKRTGLPELIFVPNVRGTWFEDLELVNNEDGLESLINPEIKMINVDREIIETSRTATLDGVKEYCIDQNGAYKVINKGGKTKGIFINSRNLKFYKDPHFKIVDFQTIRSNGFISLKNIPLFLDTRKRNYQVKKHSLSHEQFDQMLPVVYIPKVENIWYDNIQIVDSLGNTIK